MEEVRLGGWDDSDEGIGLPHEGKNTSSKVREKTQKVRKCTCFVEESKKGMVEKKPTGATTAHKQRVAAVEDCLEEYGLTFGCCMR